MNFVGRLCEEDADKDVEGNASLWREEKVPKSKEIHKEKWDTSL
jgi:hypothetical protein